MAELWGRSALNIVSGRAGSRGQVDYLAPILTIAGTIVMHKGKNNSKDIKWKLINSMGGD